MILIIDSLVRQVKFGKEYLGQMKVNGREIKYSATIHQLADERGYARSGVEIKVLSDLGEGADLEGRLGEALKRKMSEDTLLFYMTMLSEPRLQDINDDQLGGILRAEGNPAPPGGFIGSQICRRIEYGLRIDPESDLSQEEVDAFLEKHAH